MKILAIDPSVNNIGLAIWNLTNNKIRTRLHHPVRTFANANESQSMIQLANAALRFIWVDFLQGEKVDKLVVEYPAWQASTKGLIAMQKGYTLDLAFLAGAMATGFKLSSQDVYTPTPLQWKGNAPKTATQHRVQKQFGMLQISEHEVDAIGLAMWAKTQPGCSD